MWHRYWSIPQYYQEEIAEYRFSIRAEFATLTVNLLSIRTVSSSHEISNFGRPIVPVYIAMEASGFHVWGMHGSSWSTLKNPRACFTASYCWSSFTVSKFSYSSTIISWYTSSREMIKSWMQDETWYTRVTMMHPNLHFNLASCSGTQYPIKSWCSLCMYRWLHTYEE